MPLNPLNPKHCSVKKLSSVKTLNGGRSCVHVYLKYLIPLFLKTIWRPNMKLHDFSRCPLSFPNSRQQRCFHPLTWHVKITCQSALPFYQTCLFMAAVLTTATRCYISTACLKLHPKIWNPDVSSLSACALRNRRDRCSLVPPFDLIALLSLTPYSIIIIIIIIVIIFIITHQQKVTEFEEWICNFFFSSVLSMKDQ